MCFCLNIILLFDIIKRKSKIENEKRFDWWILIEKWGFCFKTKKEWGYFVIMKRRG